MKKIALKLIDKNSKDWLSKKLGISRPTLNTRLNLDNWKRAEIQTLLILDK